MTLFTDPPRWRGPSDDPNDEQFGDVVEGVAVQEADTADAVLVGEPYDGAVIGRRGAREGPAAIREALGALTTHHVDIGRIAGPVGADPDRTLSVVDCGDVAGIRGDEAGPAADVTADQTTIRAATDRVHDLDALPIFLGGDNSLTYPNAAPLLDRGTLGAISLDAHLDCRDVRDEPTSGTPYRQLHEDGLDAFAVLGARDFATSTTYHDFVTERDGVVRSARRVEREPDAAVATALDATADADAVHLTVDLDVVDAVAAPGVSAPTPGGLTPRTLCELVETLVARPRVQSVEVVELAPRLDEGGRTADLAAQVVAHALAGLEGRR